MIPLWLKLAYTVMAVVVLVAYWFRYGPRNYLWFSDVALILLVPALWLESALLAGMVATGMLALELFWCVDFAGRLAFRRRPGGLTGYMFEPQRPLWLRALSLFHIPVPAVTLYLLFVLGYDPGALAPMLVLGWGVLLASWWLTLPHDNVNWVHGFGGAPRRAHAPLRNLLWLMLLFPLLVWVPSHLALVWLFPAGG